MCQIGKAVIGGALLYMAIYDLRRKELPLYLILGVGIFAVIHTAVYRPLSWGQLFLGVAIGVVFLIFSKITKEAIGYGDSLLLLCLGIFLGGSVLTNVIMAATFGSSLFAIAAGMVKGWKRVYSFPFVPFLCAAYVGVVWI